MFLKNGVSDYSKLDKNVKETQDAGALSTSVFDCTDIHEYVVESTTFAPQSAMPFPPQQGDDSPWG